MLRSLSLEANEVALLAFLNLSVMDETTENISSSREQRTTASGKQQAGSSGTSNQSHIPSSRINTQSYQTAPSNQFIGQYVVNGLSGVDKMVLDYLLLPVNLEAIEGMVIEGLIYSSIDENHFKSTGNM
ncbi:unnamed protein product [Lactuca saligna]|uniref:Uncharacterized protein n=1 Tax=Lactuca saligna TaxID=75948 RepID=A0AA36A0L9_LACSI|nr:unnamed protein product [Lactuca saligna]